MASKRRYKSDVSEAIHSSATAMFKIGAIDKATMREFDASCLTIAPISPRKIKQIRLQAKVSQPVFARYLNTSESTVENTDTPEVIDLTAQGDSGGAVDEDSGAHGKLATGPVQLYESG